MLDGEGGERKGQLPRAGKAAGNKGLLFPHLHYTASSEEHLSLWIPGEDPVNNWILLFRWQFPQRLRDSQQASPNLENRWPSLIRRRVLLSFSLSALRRPIRSPHERRQPESKI